MATKMILDVDTGTDDAVALMTAALSPDVELVGATVAAQPQHAVDWLIDTYLASEGDITLVPVGPLTNIATAMQKEPRILDAIPEIVLMGGAHDHGNTTASAEFNIWMDPEAARIVVNSGRPIRMIPLDATHRALVSGEDCERLRALGTPAGEAAARFTLKRIEGYEATQKMHRAGAAPVHDALAVCSIIDPSIVTTQHIPVDVEVFA